MADKTELEKLKASALSMRDFADKNLTSPDNNDARLAIHFALDHMLEEVAEDEHTADAVNWALMAMWNMLARDANAACWARFVGRNPPWQKATPEELIATLDRLHEEHPDEKRITRLRLMVAVNYGMGPSSLAERIGKHEVISRSLLRAHQAAFPQFWKWSEDVLNYTMMHYVIQTSLGSSGRPSRQEPNCHDLGC